MVFHRCIVNWEWEGVDVSSVYVHSVICDTVFGVTVFHRCIVKLEFEGYMYPQYMCIL